MSSSQTIKSRTPRSKEKKPLNPKPQALDDETLSTKTPQKSESFSRRARNTNVALSIADIRRAAAKSFTDSIQKQRTDQIDSWLDEKPKKSRVGRSEKLPEKYEMLGDFFNGLDTSIRLLRLRGLKPSFSNICPQIESLTDRRFTYGHLAQLKFVLPEVIEIKKVLIKDERTSCLKPDLHVTINADALESAGKSKPEVGGSMHLRKAFRKRLTDISKSHREDYEIPEENLPIPFNRRKEDLQADKLKLPLSSAPGVLTDVRAVEQPTVSTSCLQSDEVPESNRDTAFSVEDRSACAQLTGQVPVTPMKGIDQIGNDGGLPTNSDSIQSTPAKLALTPIRLNAATPALQPQKRCYMSPDDDSTTSSLNKLTRRPPRSRSLKFDTPVKNKNVEDEGSAVDRSLKFDTSVKNKNVEDEGSAVDSTAVDNNFEILSQDLLQSIREKEKKAMEDRDPAISQAKRRRQLISSLPKFFNKINFLFQSLNRSVITKEELVHKILWTNFDIVDRKEVQEQLNLLLELAPEWISEKKLGSVDDLATIHINKRSSPDSIRAQLEAAT